MLQSKLFSPNKTLNFKGRLVDLREPKVMGILNITPDSFYKGSRTLADNVVEVARQMLAEGAYFLDVGGYSSRPGAENISLDEELSRAIPVVSALKKAFPDSLVSIDTFRSEVAKQALDNGADWVNDISAGSLDANMWKIVARANVPYIMMHMQGNPQNMNQQTDYINPTKNIMDYFHQKVYAARQSGITDLVVDPGFGFSKTAQQNFKILRHLNLFEMLELPILCGISRKSMIWKTLQITPEEALNGTTALQMLALMNGACILRVHDVRAAQECIKLYKQTYSTNED